MAEDYIPHSDGAFLEWSKTLVAYVNPKLAAFNIPAGATTEIQTLLTACEAVFGNGGWVLAWRIIFRPVLYSSDKIIIKGD
ncbi:hypothetical protein LQZ21_06760 [Treponema sp. TIM-1]|uniref:hypothetical protein n=1 Tax=Treponema sp. TIM-1 TaxID=2898417 RepID=UPI003980B198